MNRIRYVGFSTQGEFAVISLLKMFPVAPSYQCHKKAVIISWRWEFGEMRLSGGIGKNTQGEECPWDYLMLRLHDGWSIGVPYVIMLCNLNTKVCVCVLMYTLRHRVHKNSNFISCVASNYKCSEFIFNFRALSLFLSF